MNLGYLPLISFLCFAGMVALLPCDIRAQNQDNASSLDQSSGNLTPGELLTQESSDSKATTWNLQTKVGQIVADRPASARVLELVGIDYCCGGQKSLAEAAKEKQVDANQLLNALLVVGTTSRTTPERNWQQVSLEALMSHIVDTHHNWLRRELPPLFSTTQTVRRVHGDAHPELAEVEKTLEQIKTALLPHLNEEEKTVFPAIEQLEQGNPPTGIAIMLASLRSDHDELGGQLHRLRELTDGYAVPKDACVKYREMLTGLADLESDMLQHVHLENNILLPRALKLLGK